MTAPDMNSMLAQARAMQEQVVNLRDGLTETEVTGSSRGGAVVVTMSVGGDFKSVRIDPEVLADGQHEVEDAMLSALKDTARQLREVTTHRLAGLQDMFNDIGIR